MIAVLHQSSIKYVDLILDHDTVAVKMTVAPSDLTEPLHLAPDAQPSAIDAATPAAARYVRDWIAIAGCTPAGERAVPDLDNRFVAVSWQLQCFAAPTGELDLDLRAFFAVDARHEAIVRFGELDPIVIRASAPRWAIPAGKSRSRWPWVAIPLVLIIAGGAGVVVVRRKAV